VVVVPRAAYTLRARNRPLYSTDTTDAEWRHWEPHVPPPRTGGGPRRHSSRESLQAVFSIWRSGWAWRLMPHDLPPWQTFSHDCRLGRLQGLCDTLHAALRRYPSQGRAASAAACGCFSIAKRSTAASWEARGAMMEARKSMSASASCASRLQGW
jgi:transposase